MFFIDKQSNVLMIKYLVNSFIKSMFFGNFEKVKKNNTTNIHIQRRST